MAFLPFGAGSFFVAWAVLCIGLSSIPDLYPRDASRVCPPCLSGEKKRSFQTLPSVPWGAKLPLPENHSSTGIKGDAGQTT